MANLYELAGAGKTGGAGIASGVFGAAGGLAAPLTFVNPIAGLALGAASGIGSLVSNIFGHNAAEEAGKQMYNQAQQNMASKIAANPYKYSDLGVRQAFSSARSDIEKANQVGTNALLDRYTSLQRRQLQNKIRSGLTSGAAQAQAVQSNIAFQQQANQLFQQQGSQMSNLRLREGQALQQMADVVDARKQQLARRTLVGQGITDTSALGGLTEKLMGVGGY